jgi:salicylate hydroxylase
VKRLLEKINVWKMWVLCDREPARHWSKGRVTLLGDAAHPTLQYLAQGANMAIEDAAVLAAYAGITGFDWAKAFRHYEDARYKRTARVQIMSRYYGDAYHAAGVVRELRNDILAPVPGAAPDFASVAWLYDGITLPQANR